MLFVEEGGDVLLVEPTYKATWEIPGGRIEVGSCAREFALDVPLGRLLVVDWAPHVREERVRFVFDGGVLTDEQLDAIVLPPHELESWAFMSSCS